MKRYLARIAVVLVVMLGFGAAASPAYAGWSWCLEFSSQICMAEHNDGNGARVVDWGPVGACQPLGGFWNDRISSVKNTFPSYMSHAKVMFWFEAGCDGTHYTFRPGNGGQNLPWLANDEFSSFCIGPDDFAPPGCGQYVNDG